MAIVFQIDAIEQQSADLLDSLEPATINESIEQFDDVVPSPMAHAGEPKDFLGAMGDAMGDDIHVVDGLRYAFQAIVRCDASSNDAEQVLAVLVRTGDVRVLIDAATEFVHVCVDFQVVGCSSVYIWSQVNFHHFSAWVLQSICSFLVFPLRSAMARSVARLV